MSRRNENGMNYPFQNFEEIHHILIDKSPDPIFSVNSEGRYLYVNEAFAKDAEKSVDQIIGKTIWNVFDREEADQCFAALNDVFQNGEEKVMEVRVAQTDSDKYVATKIIPIKDSHGEVLKVICFSRDISQCKWAEEKLKERNKRLGKERKQIHKLLTFLRQPDIGGPEITSFIIEEAIRISESELGFLGFIDDAEKVMLAHLWSEKAMETCTIDQKPVKFPITTAGIWAESVRTCQPFIDNDFQQFHPNKKGYPMGHVAIKRYLSLPIIRGNKVVALLGLANKKQDYTDADLVQLSLFIENLWILFEKQEAEAAIIRNEAYFRALIENASDVITIADADGVIQYNSPSIEKVLGYKQSEMINQAAAKFIHMDDFPLVLETLNSVKQKPGVTLSVEFRFLDKAGSWRYLEATFRNLLENDSVKGIVINSHDISERKCAKEFEQEIYRLDQLNIIGQMAAGIGHEIRNPMTTVRGYLQLLQNRVEMQSFKDQFGLMIDEIDRANSIITEFLSLAKTRPAETKKCNLNDVITKLFPLIQADTFTKNMEIIFEPGEIPLIYLNKKEIYQLILNLCRNGLEAMEAGGCLTLKTFKDGKKVVLSVKDEGSGIPLENLDKMGKPFFSTKENGTGLGLASCYNIATRHKASIGIETGSSGTTFFIRFTCRDAKEMLLKKEANA